MISWRLLHRILGWDYVSFQFGCHPDNTIRRIKTTPNGQEYFNAYGEMVFLDKPCREYRHLTRPIKATEGGDNAPAVE